MLRNIFACLPTSGPAEACLETALRFAEGYGAWLVGLVVRESPPTLYPPVADPIGVGLASAQVIGLERTWSSLLVGDAGRRSPPPWLHQRCRNHAHPR